MIEQQPIEVFVCRVSHLWRIPTWKHSRIGEMERFWVSLFHSYHFHLNGENTEFYSKHITICIILIGWFFLVSSKMEIKLKNVRLFFRSIKSYILQFLKVRMLSYQQLTIWCAISFCISLKFVKWKTGFYKEAVNMKYHSFWSEINLFCYVMPSNYPKMSIIYEFISGNLKTWYWS